MPMTNEDYAVRIACAVADDFALKPEMWTTGSLARDADGRNVEPYDEEAVQFCALGRADYYIDRTVPEDRRQIVRGHFYALGSLASGRAKTIEDALPGSLPSSIYVQNDSHARNIDQAVAAARYEANKVKVRGAKAVAAFLRKGVAATGRTCLGRPS